MRVDLFLSFVCCCKPCLFALAVGLLCFTYFGFGFSVSTVVLLSLFLSFCFSWFLPAPQTTMKPIFWLKTPTPVSDRCWGMNSDSFKVAICTYNLCCHMIKSYFEQTINILVRLLSLQKALTEGF